MLRDGVICFSSFYGEANFASKIESVPENLTPGCITTVFSFPSNAITILLV